MSAFMSFELSDSVLKGIKALGYEEPTPIQKEAIPLLLAGKDLVGQAQTGTGKTTKRACPSGF